MKLVRDLSRLNAWFCIAAIASYFVSPFELPAILLIPIYYAPIGVVATAVLALSGAVAVLMSNDTQFYAIRRHPDLRTTVRGK